MRTPSRIAILGPNGKPVTAPKPQRSLRASYDAAQTNHLNTRHWAATDALSADEANSYDVRKTLRERARYEVTNNAYLSGIAGTYSKDVVGVCPQLQMLGATKTMNRIIERSWSSWIRAVRLGRKLRTNHRARCVDGEGFLIFQNNPRTPHEVQLDLRPLECDRVHTPELFPEANNIDGVILDDYDNVDHYEVLKDHPGGWTAGVFGQDAVYNYGAAYVLHWFAHERPEQHRGVPEVLASLPLCALLRRYTLAVVQSAETAADFTALLYTDASPDGEVADIDAFDALEIERNMMTTVPQGWKLGQFKPEQPTTQYSDFKQEILGEIGRPVDMPRNIAACDSSDYNFASGRLDHGTYFKRIVITQYDMSVEILDPIWDAWWAEAQMLHPEWSEHDGRHMWLWQGRDAIDPREARAESERLGSGATTLAQIYSSRGQDWEEEMEKGADALGISMTDYQALVRQKLFGGGQAQGPANGQKLDPDQLEEMIQDALSQ